MPSHIKSGTSTASKKQLLDLSDIPKNLVPMPSLRPGHGTSQYRGVTRAKRSGVIRYQSQIMTGGVNYYLGLFETEREAAVEYARAYQKLFGNKKKTDDEMEVEREQALAALSEEDLARAHRLLDAYESSEKRAVAAAASAASAASAAWKAAAAVAAVAASAFAAAVVAFAFAAAVTAGFSEDS